MNIPIVATPEYETTLPSGNLVKFRPFLVKEEKVLLMIKDSITLCIHTVQLTTMLFTPTCLARCHNSERAVMTLNAQSPLKSGVNV